MRSFSDFRQILSENKLFFLLVALLCLGVYLNVLNGKFVSDDIEGIVENRNLGNLFLAIKQFNFLDFLRGVIFIFLGRGSLPFHVVNLSLHILNTILAYFFILILTKSDRLATFSSLLFALHPIHTEAVSWISGGGYLLYSFFFLSSFLFFHLYVESRGRSFLVTSLALYLLGVATAIWIVPLLPFFFFYEKYLKDKGITWAFYLIVVVFGALNFLVAREAGIVAFKAAAGASAGGTKDPTITMPHSLVQYIYLLFWPLNLTIYHEGLRVGSVYILGSRVATILVMFVAPLVFLLRKIKLPLFFLLFFLASISLSLSPVKIGWYVAERYLYIGSISFCVLIATLLLWLEKKLPVKNLALFLLMPILLFYSLRTVLRNRDWQTRTSFWIATAKSSPTSHRAYNNLGNVYGWQKEWNKAIEAYKNALKIKPDHDTSNSNLGIAYIRVGNFEAAKKHLLRAIKINPKLYKAYYNLGLVYYKQNEPEEAKKYWRQALKINPSYTQVRQALITLEDEK